MHLRYYYNSTEEPLETPANEGIAEALPLLTGAEEKGIGCERIDTSQLTEEDRMHAYFDAVGPSVLKKYKIRQVFGSRRNSGWLFGKDVPALIVVDSAKQYTEDVYPRNEAGRVVTINEFLQDLLEKKPESRQ